MTSALDRIRARLEAMESRPSKRKLFREAGVKESADLRRILALPRRPAVAPELDEISDLIRTPDGRMRLRPIQVWALEELHARRGLVALVRVGGGKTLISLLAAVALGAERPLLLVKANLRDKTRAEFAELRRHWNAPMPEIMSYELLGREQSAEELRRLRPDVVIADEAHKLKNQKAAVTKRVRRYLDEVEGACRFVAMSGTLTNRSVREFAHLFEWSLEFGTPLPRRFGELTEWGLAIDEEIPPGAQRFQPGALIQLYSPEEAEAAKVDEVDATRRAVRRRIVETPGVVATTDRALGTSLTIHVVPVEGYGAEIENAFAALEDRWETPDGHPISDAVTKWRHQIELSCGFYYRWNPRPPREWLDARRDWSSIVRHILDHNRRELDSELQVANAVARGDYNRVVLTSSGMPVANGLPVDEAHRRWKAIRPTFEPNTEPVWLDDAVASAVGAWSADGPGIVWTYSVALGEMLSDASEQASGKRWPYFGAEGRDRDGRPIESARPEDGPIIASIQSSGEGRNLQAWTRSLVTPCTLSGAKWEQLLGRMHREGQTAEEVEYTFLVGCESQYGGWLKAKAESRYIQATTGQEQKLCYADILESCQGLSGPRWPGKLG